MKFKRSFMIERHVIGPDQPCFVIAEAGVNHNGDPELACQLIDAAAQCGADAVKFQTFTPERLASPTGPKAKYQIETTGSNQSQLDMLRQLALSSESFADLQQHCRSRNIVFLSTPFEEDSIDVLDHLDISAFKVPSGEITNLPFLRHLAAKGRPIILSTGMATLSEVEKAAETLAASRCTELAILHCVSAYPADASECNLRAMQTLATAFEVPVGFSDHTLGTVVAIASAALGAKVIEKHLTLDRNMQGPDHRASLEPDEFAGMVSDIRAVQSSLGDGIKRPHPREADIARVTRKSIVALCELHVGVTITRDMVGILRPGTGIAPEYFETLVGRRVSRPVQIGTPLLWSDFE